MRPLGLDELVAIDAYEGLRDAYRARVRTMKRERRLAVGDRATLVFENRETVRFQVQEMLRIERLRDPKRIQRELEVYNELVPAAGELSATLLIEITDSRQIRGELDRLIGIDSCVFLVLGDGPGARRVRARFDERQLAKDRISAVHYLKLALDDPAQVRLRDPGVRAFVAIDHESYRHAALVPPALRAALLADLAGDPEPLLVPPAGERASDAGASGRVRVRPVEPPAGRGHVVVEPLDAPPSLLDLDPALQAELWAAVQAQARELLRRHGSCRVLADLHAGRPAWHVFAPDA